MKVSDSCYSFPLESLSLMFHMSKKHCLMKKCKYLLYGTFINKSLDFLKKLNTWKNENKKIYNFEKLILLNALKISESLKIYIFYICFCYCIVIVILLFTKLLLYLFTGMVVGSYIWGCLADIKGRKVVLIATLLMDGIVGVVSSFVQYFWIFLVFRFFNGFA